MGSFTSKLTPKDKASLPFVVMEAQLSPNGNRVGHYAERTKAVDTKLYFRDFSSINSDDPFARLLPDNTLFVYTKDVDDLFELEHRIGSVGPTGVIASKGKAVAYVPALDRPDDVAEYDNSLDTAATLMGVLGLIGSK